MPECLTCNTTFKYTYTEPFENAVVIGSADVCAYYSASFSPNGEYYALECLGDKIPHTYVKSINDKDIECKRVYLCAGNEPFLFVCGFIRKISQSFSSEFFLEIKPKILDISCFPKNWYKKVSWEKGKFPRLT